MIRSSTRTIVPRLLVLALGSALASQASAGSWMWDQNANRIDDRIEQVEASGLAYAFENQDVVNGRLAFAVETVAPGLQRYGVYVGFEHYPTDADIEAIRASGVDTTILHRYVSIDYVRMALTFEEINKVAQIPGVHQIESIPLMYPMNNNAVKSSGVSFSNFQRFPTVQEHLGITGKDVVVAIMDTGVNDAPDPVTGFPGHEALIGKFVAGGNFFAGNPALNTGINDSVNPVDRGEASSSTHGTHVAGTAIGTGGPSGVFGGVAPDAKLVDLKVLSDAGVGFGSADGVDWAIANMDRYGIRVLNLSLGGLNNSDGRDAGSQAINRAYQMGLVSAIAAGNDGQTNYISSPAAADFALTVGSLNDENTIDRSDDTVSGFSNEGPRLDDGDGDFVDEMKPVVAAAGAGIVSADGSLVTDGRQYKSLSGTSMSTPHVAGVVALLLEARPELTPAEVFEVLKHTSDHRNDWGKTPADARPFPQGDPNYHPSAGWGQVDAYAAVKEVLRINGDPASQTQVIRIFGEADAGGADAITVGWVSQRETALQGYNIYRAEDVNGAPGVFQQLNSALIPGVGREQIEGLGNRNHYHWDDVDGLQQGRIYWYRIEHVSAAGTFQEPALPVVLGTPQPVAQLRYSITHNAFGNDLLVLLGSGPDSARPDIILDGASPQQAVSVTTEAGEPTTGNLRHDFVIDLTTLDNVGAFLPPSDRTPWFLSVKEGGFVNRSGRVNSFEIVTFDEHGEVTGSFTTADPTPQQTVEGQTTELWIPDNPNITLPGESPTLIRIEPNVGEAGTSVQVELVGGDLLPLAAVSAGEGVTVSNVQVHSGTEATAVFAVAADATAGPRDVTVTNIDGASDTLPHAFTVAGDDAGGDPVVVEIGDDDPAVEYRIGWHRKESVDAIGGSYHRRAGSGNGAESSVRLVFEGDQITYFFARSEGGGSAEVYIDDELRETVSFAGTAPRQAPSFGHSLTLDRLGEGTHEIRIVHLGGLAYVDGFRVTSSAGTAHADGSATESRSATTVTRSAAALIEHAVQVSEFDEGLSVEVEGAGSLTTVELLGPSGELVGTAQQLLGLGGLYGLDADLALPGTYTVRVLQPSLQAKTLEISTARTVHVQ